MDFIKSSIILTLCLTVCVPNTIASQRLYTNFYNNLTELIDAALESKTVTSSDQLRDAIKFSNFIFYETDLPLSNFTGILPVISLLQDHKSANVHPQLIMSLKCVNTSTGTFLWSRLGDMFYGIQPKISSDDAAKLVNTVAAILLDFRAEQFLDGGFFQSKNLPPGFSLTEIVKDFVSYQFGKADVQVGVLYSEQFVNYYQWSESFLKRQLQSADFLVLYTELNLVTEFPMFLPEFSAKMSEKLRLHREFLQNPNVTVSIQINEHNVLNESMGYQYKSSGDYYATFGSVLAETANYSITANSLLRAINKKSKQLVTEAILEWGLVQQQDVIISNPFQNYKEDGDTNFLDKFKSGGIVPYFTVQEFIVNVCQLKQNLSIILENYEALAVDEKTWTTLARHQHALQDDTILCSSNNGTNSNGGLRVMLAFTNDIMSMWSEIEPYMKHIVNGKRIIAGLLQLDTLIFFDEDIKKSLQIQQFALATKQNNFTIGCSVSFYKLRTYFHGYLGEIPRTPETFRTVLENNLCKPIFKYVSQIIWRVHDFSDGNRLFPTEGLLNTYGDVALSREIFMSTFPDKQVIIEFDSKRDQRILGKLFNLSTILPFNHV